MVSSLPGVVRRLHIELAAQHGEGQLIPVHDVVQVVRMALSLSSASFVRELTLPAMLDERF